MTETTRKLIEALTEECSKHKIDADGETIAKLAGIIEEAHREAK
jgi:hypothetical protein